MFFTYVWRELRRRKRQALLTSLGLALGVALVVIVSAVTTGVGDAQQDVLKSLYGVGTDVTVTKSVEMQESMRGQFRMSTDDVEKVGDRFVRDTVIATPGAGTFLEERITEIERMDDVAASVGGLLLTNARVSGDYEWLEQREQLEQSGGGFGQGPPPEGEAGAGQGAGMPPIEITTYSMAGVDVSDVELGPLGSVEVVDGRLFEPGEEADYVAVISSSYARQEELAVGDALTVGEKEYEVIGTVASQAGGEGVNVYLPLVRAQKLVDSEGKINQIYVRAGSAESIPAVEARIAELLPAATVTSAEDLAEQVSGSLGSASSLADRLGTWLAVAVLAAAFLVAGLLTMAGVSRRTTELGTLKALGWRSRRIVGQVMGESLLQGVIGAVLGVGLGVLGAVLVAQLSPDLQASVSTGPEIQEGGMVGRMAGDLLDTTRTVSIEMTAPVGLELVLLAVGLALAGAVFAGILGGWRAARLRPAEALRRVE
ncbi:MAG: ABC transporter permease [Actinobacteria bacterium]|nr:ABC transporter permease [Actinomycetota bacterium]